MQLIEHDGKTLLAQLGIAVLPRRLLAPDEDPPSAEHAMMVKAQVRSGGRGKAGLVRRAEAGDLAQVVGAVRALLRGRGEPAWVMLEQPVEIAAELYLAITVDDVACAPCLLFSNAGGVEVERHPAQVRRLPIDMRKGLVGWQVVQFLRESGLAGEQIGAASRFALALWRAWCALDAELIEINPLAVVPGKGLVPLDAKVILDDHAEARHPQRGALVSAQLTARKAGEMDTFVEMPGDIGLLTGGAGLGMAVLDMLADAGLRAATFVDGAGGGGPGQYEEKARRVLARAAAADIKGVLIYFTLAAASLAPIVRGTLEVLRDHPLGKPIVVGFVATAAAEAEMSAAEGRQLFIDAGFAFHAELDEAIAELARRVGATA